MQILARTVIQCSFDLFIHKYLFYVSVFVYVCVCTIILYEKKIEIHPKKSILPPPLFSFPFSAVLLLFARTHLSLVLRVIPTVDGFLLTTPTTTPTTIITENKRCENHKVGTEKAMVFSCFFLAQFYTVNKA